MELHSLNARPLAIGGVEIVAETGATLRCRVGDTVVDLARTHLGNGTQVAHVGDRGTVVVPRWLAIVSGMTDRPTQSYGHA